MLKKTTEVFLKEYSSKYPNSHITIIGEYTGVHKHIACKCNVCGYEWMSTPHELLRGSGCIKCFREKLKLTNEEFIERMKNINPNIIFLSKYIDNKTKIKCKCLIDNYEWEATPNKLLMGRGCPKCANKIIIDDEFKNKVYSINQDIIVLEKYKNRSTKLLCQCKYNSHHKWEALPGNLLHGTGCPYCVESKGEKKIRKFLEENRISFSQEYWFEDCRDKNPLPFDFYLPEYNICIEYDGKQHFEIVNFYGVNNNKALNIYQNILKHDKIKTEYCFKNNIVLIRIPFTEYNNINNILLESIKGVV